MNEDKLLLFANSKHREQYILENFLGDTVETTNLTTINNFLNVLYNGYKSFTSKDVLSNDFSVLYIKESIEEYKHKNKNSVFVKQPDYYKLASDIISLYSEMLISKFLTVDNNFFESLKEENSNIASMLEIIDIYKKKLDKEKKIDETILYNNFLASLNNGSIKNSMLDYSSINIIGFENLAYKYLAFLYSIKNGYNKNITIVLPYEHEILTNYKKNISMFNIEKRHNLSSFANSIIVGSEEIKKHKDNIYFLPAFGIKQECYTVIDKVVQLVKQGEAMYDIAIVFDNAENYHDLITERLSECGIEYEERLGKPIWQVPIIPTITSIFSVINTFEHEREVRVEELIKIFSSAYILIDGIENSKIRDIFYNKLNMFEIMPEKNFEERLQKQYDDVNISNTCSVVNSIYKLIKDISFSKSFKDITNIYKTILKKMNLAQTIEKNKKTFVRDNNALAQFIEKISEMSYIEIETDYKDYYTVLNIMLRDSRLARKNRNKKGISLLSSYDVRGLNFKHLMLLGCNSKFLNRAVQTFIFDKNEREKLNKKYNKNIIANVNENNILSRAFFYNIASNLKNDNYIYFSFRYKDENGSLELPSVFVEEIFYSLTEKSFNFEHLKEYGAVFRENYIPQNNLIQTEKEALISLFYYKKKNSKLPSNYLDILNSMYLRSTESEDTEILKTISSEIFSKPISVSDIEDILTCQARFLENKMFQYLYTDERTIGINYGTNGEIYHHCFCKLYNTIKEKYGFPITIKKVKEYENIITDIIDNLEKEKYYRLYDEKEIDKDSLKEEVFLSLNLYIKKEIERFEKDNNFIPEYFESSFDDYILYKTKSGIEIKLRGRIDRIDLSYDSNKNIDKLRIVDYKLKADVIKIDTLKNNIQLLLYLDFAINKYLKDKKSYELEIAYSLYNYKNIADDNYFINFKDTEAIKNILNSKNEESIKSQIYISIEEMLKGFISYNPSSDNCKNCQKRNRCSNAFSDY